VPAGSVVVGRNIETGERIWIPPKLRKLGVHLLGLPDHGKSMSMFGMAFQDILALCGRRRSVIFGDPHGQTVEKIFNKAVTHRLDRICDIKYLSITDPDFIF
jgi:hypothetical protein